VVVAAAVRQQGRCLDFAALGVVAQIGNLVEGNWVSR
jgi:hypothetical protein